MKAMVTNIFPIFMHIFMYLMLLVIFLNLGFNSIKQQQVTVGFLHSGKCLIDPGEVEGTGNEEKTKKLP